MSSRLCKNCEWWLKAQGGVGHCLRYPPVVNVRLARIYGSPKEYRFQADSSFRGVWPETHPNEWCGEFTEKTIENQAGQAGGNDA